MNEFLYALWLFLPAGVANMVPVVVWRLPGLRDWNTPVDFGRELKGARIFGANKTWRGIFSGVIAATIVFYLQQKFMYDFGSFSEYLIHVGYGNLTLWIGVLLGFGALLGDLIESFIKRQKRIASGRSWFPFDQLDYIIGACLITAPFYRAELVIYVLIFVNWFALHLLFSFLGYILRFKNSPI